MYIVLIRQHLYEREVEVLKMYFLSLSQHILEINRKANVGN